MAAKVKTIFICNNCSYKSPKWVGKCPECSKWNSFQEEIVKQNLGRKHKSVAPKNPEPLTFTNTSEERLILEMNELNRVLGGGILEGSITLLSGEPGIGKSTLTLQICNQISSLNKNVLYISGEESKNQIASRALRLNVKSESISFLAETNLETIISTIENIKPDFIVIDSIQVIHSADLPSGGGSIGQIRFAAERFMNFAKEHNIPILLIGHVTKDGIIAGPRVLEHLVDTVLFLDGDRYQDFRILRSQKNRFGSTNEIGIFEMHENGLQEVNNASELFLEGRKENTPGSSIAVIMEGTRPLLVEIQALCNITPFGYPKRTATGFDTNRVQLLISVLQKHAKLNLSNQDIFVNVVGGLKIKDPSGDIAALVAIASSFLKKNIQEKTAFIGEVGLSGEIRSISQLSKRIQEAEKLGYKILVIPRTKENIKSSAEIITITDIQEALNLLK